MGSPDEVAYVHILGLSVDSKFSPIRFFQVQILDSYSFSIDSPFLLVSVPHEIILDLRETKIYDFQAKYIKQSVVFTF